MNLLELLIITIGISFDIFAGVEREGAQLADINKPKMMQVCLAAVLCQTLALYLGHLGAVTLNRYENQEHLTLAARMFAALTFLALGIRMLLKAWKNEAVQEHLAENGLGLRKFLRLATLTTAYTILAGTALGLLETSIVTMLILMICITAAAVVTGLYTGYHFGCAQRAKAYAIGGLLLLLGGTDVIVRYVML